MRRDRNLYVREQVSSSSNELDEPTTSRQCAGRPRPRCWSACCCRAGRDDGAPLEELEGLAAAAGARVVGQMVQRREAPDAATYLGKGKVEELTSLAAATDADVVIFDNDLSPGQDPQPGTGRRA